MHLPRLPILSCAVVLLTLSATALQNPPSPAPTIDNDFIQKQFGSSCTLLDTPPLKADLDGDGIEDLVIAARCKNPLADQVDDNFKVIDPFASFFGYGNPKISTQFATDVPERRGISLLIIHGSGDDAWHSANPKSKFVIIDLPFRDVSLKKMKLKKKTIMAIYIEETGADQMTSVLFWDGKGKNYRYTPLGASME
jgi:hypothetical protein